MIFEAIYGYCGFFSLHKRLQHIVGVVEIKCVRMIKIIIFGFAGVIDSLRVLDYVLRF